MSRKDFLDCVRMQYSSAQIALALNTHEELAIIKDMILNRHDYKFNIPYLPRSTYWGEMSE